MDSSPKTSAPSLLTIRNEGFHRQREGAPCKYNTHTTQLTVLLKLVISGLTSSILIVLGAVNPQFQDQFVSVPLRPVLGTVAAYIMATVCSSCS